MEAVFEKRHMQILTHSRLTLGKENQHDVRDFNGSLRDMAMSFTPI